MKKNILTIAVILSAWQANAQNYESIRNMVSLAQYEQAKTSLDNSMANAAFSSKPEAYILKASIYSGLSMDDKKKNTPEAYQLTIEADKAFLKYKEKDPSMALLEEKVYQNAPINLYSSYYGSGYNDYKAKKWDEAYHKLQKAVEYSDLLIKRRLLQVSVDTNVLILAGVTAENSSFKNEAVLYYGRLADLKIIGDGFESVYRYLVNYYFQKKDFIAFEKYKASGHELYPTSEYFNFDKVDFSVGLATDFPAKLKAIEDLLAKEPNDFKANEVLGEIIYDVLNPKNDADMLPANAEQLEKRMIVAFNKAIAAKPGYENPFIYLGDHFINKAVKVNEASVALSVATQNKIKSGATISKEELAKRDALNKQYADMLVRAKAPYESAAKIFSTRTALTVADTKQYKKVVSYLATIASFKKTQYNEKSADAIKYAAEEKKWDDLWKSL